LAFIPRLIHGGVSQQLAADFVFFQRVLKVKTFST